MKNIGEDIWVHDDIMSLAGTQLRLRMTIIKLSDGALWLHSPTAPSPDLLAKIKQLGTVAFIVGASNGHNIWLSAWQDAFPNATLFISSGIVKKIKTTRYQLLDESQENIWHDDLLHDYMSGVPFFNESVFLHKKTKSLIVTDLIQHYNDDRTAGVLGFIAKKLFNTIGFKGLCVAPPLKMGFMIKDKISFIAFIERIKRWDFDKIIVTHGDIIDTDAKQIFSKLCARFTDKK